jgi:hypothetical protein
MSPLRAASGRPIRRIDIETERHESVLPHAPEPVGRRHRRLRRVIDWFLRLPDPRWVAR